MGREERADWCARLRNALAADADTLKRLTPSQAASVLHALWLTNLEHAAAVGRLWLEVWGVDEVSVNEAAWLMTAAKPDDPQQRQAFEDYCLAQAGKSTLSVESYWRICFAWQCMDDPAKARDWGLRAWQAALADPEPRRLAATAHVANTVELLDAAFDLAPYAEALAALADAGRLDIEPSWNTCEGLAVPLRTQAARDTLRDALLNGDGSPRLAVAKILAIAYRDAGQAADWTAYVESALAAKPTGDPAARWLLARAYAQAVKEGGVVKSFGQPWYVQAADTPQSPELKLAVLREMIDALRGHTPFPVVTACLDRAAQTLHGDQNAAAIRELRSVADARRGEGLTESIASTRYHAEQFESMAEAAARKGKTPQANTYLQQARQCRDLERTLTAELDK